MLNLFSKKKLKLSEVGKNLIKSQEQCRLYSYLPTPQDVLTIGWGDTCYKGGPVTPYLRITQKEADEEFNRDIAYFEDSVNRLVKVKLKQFQFDALISLTYNIGVGNFAKSTLLRLVNEEDFDAAANQFQRWIYQQGKSLRGLIKRRELEKELFKS